MKRAALCAVLALCAWVGPSFATPCAEEDSTACHWDAQERGNGEGRSYLTTWTGHTLHYAG